MITKLRRLWCTTMHTSPANVQGLWGPTYGCRRCFGLRFENPALDGPLTVPSAAVQAHDTPALARLWRETR
jgi:hypothetical protein